MTKLTESELSELRATMYQSESDDTPEILKMETKEPDLQIAGKYVVINLNGKEVIVPSVAYVARLEKTISDQSRDISRLTSAIKLLRQAYNKLGSKVDTVDREMANKIDMRKTLP